MGVWAIDVSRWQGRIDWPAVKAAGVQGAWIKVGGADGGRYRDSQAARNLAGAQAAGMPFGTYYFCSADQNPIEQARHAVSCGHGVGQLWPAADLETNPAGVSRELLDTWLAMFCGEVMRLTDRESIWYGGHSTGVGYTTHAPRHCAVWIANYGANRPGTTQPATFAPKVPPVWGRWDVWQFNSVTRISGITENTCDQNVITDEFWARMLGDEPTMKELQMKGVLCPDHTGDTVWDLTMDGYGNRRRRGISDQEELAMLKDVGVIDGEVELRGARAERFLAKFPEHNTQHLADFGALALAMDTKDYVRVRTDELRTAIDGQSS